MKQDRQKVKNKKQERLGTDKIGKLLYEFSVPATIGMMVNAMYNIVDRMFVGQAKNLAENGLAALTVSFPVMMIMMGLALLFGVGGAALFSIKLGEKDKEGAGVILGNAVAMIFISAFVFMIVALVFLEPLLLLFGADEQSMPYAMEYMKIILYASILQAPAMGCNHFMRADGNPKAAMISMLIGGGFNIVFDFIFIFIFHMGMTGAALATIGGQGLSAAWGITYFLTKRSNIRLRRCNMKLQPRLVAKIMQAGMPSFSNQITNSILAIVLNNKLREYGGSVAIAGMGAVSSLQQLMILPIIGISQGSQPIIGYNRGARQYHRIRETLIKAIMAGTVIVVFGFLVTRLFPRNLISLFGNGEKFVAFGSKAISKWFLFLPVVGCQMVGSLYFQSVGKPKVSLFLTLTRQLIYLIPAIVLLSSQFGLNGILYAGPTADVLSFLTIATFLMFEFRRLNKLMDTSLT